MKTTDHNVTRLKEELRAEAKKMRERARHLDDLAAVVHRNVKDGYSNVHTFEYVAQQAISEITHRSSVMPQSIARYCTLLAADAAVEWAEKERIAAMDAALAAELGT